MIDLALVISLIGTWLRVEQHGWAQTHSDVLRMAGYWIAFTLIDLLCGWVAYRLERRERRYPALLLLAQRIVYRQLMYSVVIRALAAALRRPWLAGANSNAAAGRSAAMIRSADTGAGESLFISTPRPGHCFRSSVLLPAKAQTAFYRSERIVGMLTRARLSTAAAVVGLLALAPAAYGWARTTPQGELQRAIAGRTAGAPVDCIPISRIDSTRIIDRTAIIFDTVGRTLYVNTPPNGASQLDSGEALVIDTHTPELCSIDIVRLHEFGQRGFAGFVGLGKFVPYTKQG